MARLLLTALRQAGYDPVLASSRRLYDGSGTRAETIAAARAEGEALSTAWAAGPAASRPALWFTYHVYYKAPDVIGPLVARRLNIPYVVAEGSRAAKRAAGPWAAGHALAEAALDQAAAILILNEADRPGLAAAAPPGQHLTAFPPFVDPADWPDHDGGSAVRAPLDLLTVAMMREGDKLDSYRLLADALSRCADLPWRLRIVGDGPARPAVEAMFRPFGDRVSWHGRLERAALSLLYRTAGLLIWPAVNEAFGMVFLEAALHGCPSLAGNVGGVGGVIRDGETGLLVPPGDPAALATALAGLADAPGRAADLGAAARRFVLGERTLAAAAARLKLILDPILKEAASCPMPS
ncbi:glycosyltransferase [Zavarzinia compransoris]|uniref:glycosyltransferase family 4 protein n=1 Tax=Zavarzinia marina TaxID=2911065 RepID=UPI001F29FFFF|nr:glycosyltransferase [Zavarzinia marina]MCF4167336.1 glycosyltransferase [Zavarzinia marina]